MHSGAFQDDRIIRRVGHLRLYGAGVGAGGALLARGSVGTWLRAVAHAALAVATAAAQHADAGHAHVRACGAVAVLALPAGVALTEATVALAMIWKEACAKKKGTGLVPQSPGMHQNLHGELGLNLLSPIMCH